MKRLIFAFAMLFAVATPSFAGSGSMGCFQAPANDTYFDKQTGFDKQGERKKAYDSFENPAQELMMCAMAMATQPVAEDNCRCIERVKELCGYGFDDGDIFYKAKGGAELSWCLAFPLHMWHRL